MAEDDFSSFEKAMIPVKSAVTPIEQISTKTPSSNKKSSSDEKPKQPRTPRTQTTKKIMKIPDFNDLLKFCEKHLDDYEIEQFYKHTIPRVLYKEKFGSDRGGGGWSGAVKATINILRKMKDKKEL